jgi:hypothetical protein
MLVVLLYVLGAVALWTLVFYTYHKIMQLAAGTQGLSSDIMWIAGIAWFLVTVGLIGEHGLTFGSVLMSLLVVFPSALLVIAWVCIMYMFVVLQLQKRFVPQD